MATLKGLRITEGSQHCRFSVHVVPRSRRNAVVGLYGDALKVRLTAPPVDGKANQALIDFLAQQLSVARTDVEIVSGHASRHKIVQVSGVRESQIHTLLDTAE